VSESSWLSRLIQPKGGTPSSLIPGLKSARMRQYLVVGSLFAAVYVGLYLIFATSSNDKPQQQIAAQQALATTHIAAAGEPVDPRDRWIGTAGNQMASQETRLGQQEQATKDLMAKFALLQDEIRHRPGSVAASTVSASTSSAAAGASSSAESPVATAAQRLLVPPPAVPAPYPPGTPSQAAHTGALPPPILTPPPVPVEPSVEIGHVRLSGAKSEPVPANASGASRSLSPGGSGKVDVAQIAGQNFLPVGFVRSKLLGGILASTGGQAQANPMPVFIRLKDLAMLPNEFRANVRDCLVVGAGYGDLAAERVYVRTELLSCIDHSGRVLEVKAAGSVFDDDGKLGLRGRLISKQDKILTQALLSGVIGGIGQGMQAISTTQTPTAFGGTVSTPNPGQEFRAGIGAGVGRALDRLASYQISLAEKVFPVIEVDSDRSVDVAFTKGVELPMPLPALSAAESDDD
jgi:conjugal transfer pilus assembly protein TraB